MPDELLTSTSPAALSDAGPPQLPAGQPAAPEAGLRPVQLPHPYDEPSPDRYQRRPNNPRAPPRRHHLDRRAGKLLVETEGDLDELLTTREVAALLGVSKQFMEIARHKSCGPKFVSIAPRMIRYRRGDVREWLRERTHSGTSEYVDPATSRRISRQVRGLPIDAA